MASTNKAAPTLDALDTPRLAMNRMRRVELALTGVMATDRTSSPSVICGMLLSHGRSVVSDESVASLSRTTCATVPCPPMVTSVNSPTLAEIDVVLTVVALIVVNASAVIDAEAAFNVTVETADVDSERLVIVVTDIDRFPGRHRPADQEAHAKHPPSLREYHIHIAWLRLARRAAAQKSDVPCDSDAEDENSSSRRMTAALVCWPATEPKLLMALRQRPAYKRPCRSGDVGRDRR